MANEMVSYQQNRQRSGPFWTTSREWRIAWGDRDPSHIQQTLTSTMLPNTVSVSRPALPWTGQITSGLSVMVAELSPSPFIESKCSKCLQINWPLHKPSGDHLAPRLPGCSESPRLFADNPSARTVFRVLDALIRSAGVNSRSSFGGRPLVSFHLHPLVT